MKENTRGQLTEEITSKYGISIMELRLMPYLQYLLVNHEPVNPAKMRNGEREILQRWRDEGKITFSCTESCTITKEFWNTISDIIFMSYVYNKESE